jgi:hypothetical protein
MAYIVGIAPHTSFLYSFLREARRPMIPGLPGVVSGKKKETSFSKKFNSALALGLRSNNLVRGTTWDKMSGNGRYRRISRNTMNEWRSYGRFHMR